MDTRDVRLALFCGALLGLMACDAGPVEDPSHPTELVGAWSSTTLPSEVFVTPDGGFTYGYRETSRTLTLEASGHFAERVTYVCTQGDCPDVSPSELTGRWEVDGDSIVVSGMRADGHVLEDGLIPPRAYSFDGQVLVFEGSRFARAGVQ